MKNSKKTKTKKTKNKEVKNFSNGLGLIIYILLIVLISLVSFLGIFVKSKNTTNNKVKEYLLGSDIDKVRSIIIKTTQADSSAGLGDDANELEMISDTEETEEAENTEETKEDENNYDNYIKSKKIIEDRLKYMKLDYYDIKLDESNGTINIEIPDGELADYAAQYSITKGEFKVTDSETDELLLDNSDVKKASVAYYTTSSGTNVYLDIKFNKEGKEKLRDISNKYREVDEEEEEEEESEEINEETEQTSTEKKQIKMTVDDQTILTSSFDEEISTGELQLTLGSSSDKDQLNEYVRQASNISIFLNTEPLPIDYEMDTNKVIYSQLSEGKLQLMIIVLSSIIAILLIYMVIKYKFTGLLGAIASIGYLAILLLSIRYTNVVLTLSGIFGVFGSTVLETIMLSKLFNVYKKDLDKETKHNLVKKEYLKELQITLPILIISIIFTLFSWQTITSLGMVLFYGIIEILLLNLINIKIICRKEGK